MRHFEALLLVIGGGLGYLAWYCSYKLLRALRGMGEGWNSSDDGRGRREVPEWREYRVMGSGEDEGMERMRVQEWGGIES